MKFGPEYRWNRGFKKTCRSILALHLLPKKKIKGELLKLQQEATRANLDLEKLFEYINTNWIKKKCFRPVRWSQYFQFIRTNIDCEGWNRRLYARFKCKPSLFKLILALEEEALGCFIFATYFLNQIPVLNRGVK